MTPITLGDDANRTTLGTIEIATWGGACLIQEVPLPQPVATGNTTPSNASPFLKSQGNIRGPLVFSVTRSFDSMDAAALDFSNALKLVGAKDALKMYIGTKVFTYADSVLESVMKDNGKSSGVRWVKVFTFRIGKLTFT